MQKRGQAELILKPTFEILIAIFVFFLFIYLGRMMGSGEIYQRVRTSNENSLSIDALSAVPDNAYLLYKENTSKFQIAIGPSSVKTYTKPDDPLFITRDFVKTTPQELNINLEYPNYISIGKSGNQLEIEKDKIPIIDKYRCPAIETILPSIITIAPQTKNNELNQFTNAIASRLNAKTTDTIKDRPEFALEIIPSPQPEKATAYIKPDIQSRKIACHIINNMLAFYPDLEIEILVSDRLNAEKGVSLALHPNLETSATVSAITEAFEAS
jgi:hypothetical protein